MLGFNQVSWNNLPGQLPIDLFLFWAEMTENEKAAAVVLGYTQVSWDNDSGLEPQPAWDTKRWAELTVCADGKDLSISQLLSYVFVLWWKHNVVMLLRALFGV